MVAEEVIRVRLRPLLSVKMRLLVGFVVIGNLFMSGLEIISLVTAVTPLSSEVSLGQAIMYIVYAAYGVIGMKVLSVAVMVLTPEELLTGWPRKTFPRQGLSANLSAHGATNGTQEVLIRDASRQIVYQAMTKHLHPGDLERFIACVNDSGSGETAEEQ